jgi:hypothetical protein
MSAEIEVSAPSMLGSIGSLKTTPLIMHRIYFEVCAEKTWYALMTEARAWFGKDWKTQSHVKRKFDKHVVTTPVTLWFDVPDAKFGTWVAVKLAVRVVEPPNK